MRVRPHSRCRASALPQPWLSSVPLAGAGPEVGTPPLAPPVRSSLNRACAPRFPSIREAGCPSLEPRSCKSPVSTRGRSRGGLCSRTARRTGHPALRTASRGAGASSFCNHPRATTRSNSPQPRLQGSLPRCLHRLRRPRTNPLTTRPVRPKGPVRQKRTVVPKARHAAERLALCCVAGRPPTPHQWHMAPRRRRRRERHHSVLPRPFPPR